jgi:small subunit ribosomal protein S16
VIKLRLRRMGAKKRPFYRIVAAEHSSPRDGRFIEVLGHYDPLTEPATVKVNEERARYWLSVGAKPSETVEGLLKRAGVITTTAATEQPATPAAEASA